MRSDAAPVGQNRNRSIAVGFVEANSELDVTRDSGGIGLAVGIVFTDRNYGDARIYRLQKISRRRSFASVMRHFQKIRLERIGVARQNVFNLALGIAGEEEMNRAEADAQDDGIIIRGLRSSIGRIRPENLCRGAIPPETLPCKAMDYGNATGRCFGEQIAIGCGIFITSHPQLADFEIIQNRAQAIDVIVVRVRQQDHIEALNSTRPEIRRDNLLADVEAGVVAADVYFAS